MKTFGCIGCGNMGSAILRGLAAKEGLAFTGFDRNENALAALRDDINFQPLASEKDVAEKADYILLAVKPDMVEAVLGKIAPALTKDKVVISIAAGVSQAALKEYSKKACPVVRCMPNTPAMVGEGIFALCFEDADLSDEHQAAIQEIFGTIGQALVLEEKKFNAFTAVAGCGPAYVFHFMEAVVEAAVTVGFTRKDATDMVIKLFKGSVKLADESDQHLSVLREMVCSPAGVTIAAVNHLDRTAVRGNIIDAVLEARQRGLEMSK
ncbi:MAG: pyrroline-5-carboxylate reductase [Halodesulfovibrio sp.]